MNFQSAVFLNLAFVFLGAFLGSLACILCGKVFKKKYFHFRLSLCFLLLSAAIVFAALFVISEKTASGAAFAGHVRQDALVVAIYFFAGLFCAASLRVFFPIAAILYIGWTLAFGIFLYKKAPLPQKYTLTVSESFVRDEESAREWKFSSQSQGAFVDFSVCELDKNALFPLPRFWHSLSGARTPSEAAKAQDFLTDPSADGAGGIFGGAQEKFFARAAKKLLGQPYVYSLEIPKQALYPVIFEVKVSCDGGKFSAKLEKIM
ncbi:MAG: hypothetical protein IK015_08980 [Treponema sp.]|nr:hypothetical protein [Treponema sp.]